MHASAGRSLSLRIKNQLGYKMVKWIERIEFVQSEKLLRAREEVCADGTFQEGFAI